MLGHRRAVLVVRSRLSRAFYAFRVDLVHLIPLSIVRVLSHVGHLQHIDDAAFFQHLARLQYVYLLPIALVLRPYSINFARFL